MHAPRPRRGVQLPYPLPCADGAASSTKGHGPGAAALGWGRNGVSGRVQRGDGDGGAQRGDTSQARFDWTGRRQVEKNSVLVLFDLRRHFAEREDHRRGLRGGQWGVRQRVSAEGMVEDRGGARQHEAHGVGEEGRRGGAVTVKITLDRLNIVFAIAPRTVEFCIHPLRRRRLEGGDDKAWIVASGHDFGFDNPPPGLGPGRGSIGERLIHTAAGGRALAIGLGLGGPLLGAPARLLHDGRRLPEQDSIASQAEDKIDPASMGQHLEHLWGGKMAVPTDEEMGPWPVPPQHGEEPHQDHGIFLPGGRVPGRRQAVTKACEVPSKMHSGK